MTHRSWFQSQNSLQLPTNLKKRIVCELKKGEKIIKNNCNDLTNFFVCFLHIISYKNVWDLSKKIVKMSWTFFVKIEVLTQIVRIIWCNLWCHIKHCVREVKKKLIKRRYFIIISLVLNKKLKIHWYLVVSNIFLSLG